jgi:hypothetical protein
MLLLILKIIHFITFWGGEKMEKSEFQLFMRSQIDEIKKYSDDKNQLCPECFKNQYALEWIEKYSEEFRKKWNN